MDAIEAERPEVILYRRTEAPAIKPNETEKLQQYKAVNDFFKSNLFYSDDGRIIRGINEYTTPDDFRQAFETGFEAVVLKLLESRKSPEQSENKHRVFEAAMPSETLLGSYTELWAKISLPDSEGLKRELPAIVSSGDVIEKEDTRSTDFLMEFPETDPTGAFRIGKVCLQVDSREFTVDRTNYPHGECSDSEIMLVVRSDEDTPTAIFYLDPSSAQTTDRLARVRLELLQQGKVIARTAVTTRLVAEVTQQKDMWQLSRQPIITQNYYSEGSGNNINIVGSDDTIDGGNIDQSRQSIRIVRCLVPEYSGTVSKSQKDRLWDKYFTEAPQRLRQSVEQSKIVKRA